MRKYDPGRPGSGKGVPATAVEEDMKRRTKKTN